MFAKIIKKLEMQAEERYKAYCIGFNSDDRVGYDAYVHAVEIVQQEADKYRDFDVEFAKKCVKLAEKMNVCDLISENCRLSRHNRFMEVELEIEKRTSEKDLLQGGFHAVRMTRIFRQTVKECVLRSGQVKNSPDIGKMANGLYMVAAESQKQLLLHGSPHSHFSQERINRTKI